MNVPAQIISLIGFVFFVFSVQMKEKNKLIILQLIANFLYAINYLLLNVKMAFYMNLISCIRCVILYFSKKEKPSLIYLFILTGMICVIGVYNYDGWLSLIPVGITILYTVSTWQNNMKVIRCSFILAALIWIFYNYVVGAYASIVGNLFEIISGIVSLKRFKKEN